jgi:hypothetical protein
VDTFPSSWWWGIIREIFAGAGWVVDTFPSSWWRTLCDVGVEGAAVEVRVVNFI